MFLHEAHIGNKPLKTFTFTAYVWPTLPDRGFQDRALPYYGLSGQGQGTNATL